VKRQSGNGILWLKLDEASRQLLQANFPATLVMPFYDHVTLAYDVSRESIAPYIGQSAGVVAYAYATNGKVEAVRVETAGLPDTYGVPHVTLSTAVGIQPFEAVAMLHGEHAEQPIEPSLTLTGKLEFVPLQA